MGTRGVAPPELLYRTGAPPPPPVHTYATWNPADKAATVTLSAGNLTATGTALGATGFVRSTIGKSSSSTEAWQWEHTILAVSQNAGPSDYAPQLGFVDLARNVNLELIEQFGVVPVTGGYERSRPAGNPQVIFGTLKHYFTAPALVNDVMTIGWIANAPSPYFVFYLNGLFMAKLQHPRLSLFTWYAGFGARQTQLTIARVSTNFGQTPLQFPVPIPGVNQGLWV